MATLPDIAREAGLDPLVCRACGRSIRTTKILRKFFHQILARLRAGEPVKIRGFGTFRPATHTPRGFARSSGPQPVVRFSLTKSAKRRIKRDS